MKMLCSVQQEGGVLVADGALPDPGLRSNKGEEGVEETQRGWKINQLDMTREFGLLKADFGKILM